MEPASWAEVLGLSKLGASGAGVVYILILAPILFFFLLWFSSCWWSRGQIYDFSMNMGDRSWWSQHLGQNNWGYWYRMHWGQGELSICNFIINCIYLFSGFSWYGRSRGQMCDFSMNMGSWSQWINNIGRQHQGYKRMVHRGQGWC